MTSQLTQYVIVPVGPEASPGCSLAYSIAGGSVSRTELPLDLPSRTIATAVPAATLVTRGSTNSTTPTQPSPDTPGTPASPFSDMESAETVKAKVSPTAGATDSGLKLLQANVHALLITTVGNGNAGSASKMGAIALKGGSGDPSTLSFNQPVGPKMAKALEEVAKFTQLHHGGWPLGYQIELSFADKYSNKDGPSAAVASALLLHSMITGKELDPLFAVTGDMNADGSVQPIGGVAAKIRGATRGHCKLVAIPTRNESDLGDLLLSDGPTPFASIQIFSIGDFREAEALAVAMKSEKTQAAIAEMSRVQEVLMRNPAQMVSMLRNQHVIARLQQVLKDTPNNLSAKYLLSLATNRASQSPSQPQLLSLAGSLSAIESTGGELVSAIKANDGDAFNSIGKGSLGSVITRLQNLRARCDVRTRAYADALADFGLVVKEVQERPAQTYARKLDQRNKVYAAARSAVAERERLQSDPRIQEELKK